MAVETRDDNVMPFVVRGVSSYLTLEVLFLLVQKSTKAFVVPNFSLKNGELVTDSRPFAVYVDNY